jgi:exosome complex component RRP4
MSFNRLNVVKKNKRTPKEPTQPTPKEQTPKLPTPKEQTPRLRISKEQTPKQQTPKEQTPSIQTLKSETSEQQPPKEQKRQVNALLIVDVQYDFIDGSLALKNCPSQHQGEHVIPILNKLLNDVHFDVVVYTQDWHTPDHISFYDNLPLRAHLLSKESKPIEELKVFDVAIFEFKYDIRRARVEQILWPIHCVQNTHGAEIHADLKILQSDKISKVYKLLKGNDSDIDSYSAFWDNQKIRETSLHDTLQEHNVTHVFIGGIATDVCVYSTALHSVEYGYKTYIIEDACRGVDENNINLRLDELIARNCSVTQAANVKNLV